MTEKNKEKQAETH